MTVRHHSLVPDGRRHELSRKAVLCDLADLPAWLAEKPWAGEPVYIMAEPLHGPLSRWRKSVKKSRATN